MILRPQPEVQRIRHLNTHSTGMCVWMCVQAFAEGRGSSFSAVSRGCFGLCLHSRPYVFKWEQWHGYLQDGEVIPSLAQHERGKNLIPARATFIKINLESNKDVCWVLCMKVFKKGSELVFKSRLKIRTGRARFRETGKLMQGNGLRHQPAHCRLC